MKKAIIMCMIVICLMFGMMGCGVQADTENMTDTFTLEMQIGSPVMTIDGEKMSIDEERGTAPVVMNGRTLLPVRAVIEAMGGAVYWEEDTQNVIIALEETVIILTIDAASAFVNTEEKTLDITPCIINNRTMLPIRFISENLGYRVQWIEEEQKIIIAKEI